MSIALLRANHVRNLVDVEIQPHPQLNIIFGENASGKTSLLEAIYFLSTAKSFRTHRITHVIQYGQDKLSLFCRIKKNQQTHQIGVERSRNKTTIRVDRESIQRLSVLTRQLPIQLITPQVNSLLEQGPKMRRRFLDWGVFHVKPDYLNDWRRFHRMLQQRNASLRQRQSIQQVMAWNRAYVETAMKITSTRRSYLNGIKEAVEEYTERLIGQLPTLNYQQGWPEGADLEQILIETLEKDLDRGFSQMGPHRAELSFKFNGVPAQEVLSRGQTKLFISALQLAQVTNLAREQGIQCVILIDDLAAELDLSRRAALLDLLMLTKAQVFITVTEASLLDIGSDQGCKLFHVERGLVTEVL